MGTILCACALRAAPLPASEVSAPALAPRAADAAAWQRVLSGLGRENTRLLEHLRAPENRPVLRVLLKDPVLRPVFLAVPDKPEQAQIYDPGLLEELGGDVLLDRFGGFSIGSPHNAERFLRDPPPSFSRLAIGVTDRPYPGNLIEEYPVSSNRQCFFPLENGLWLGVKGCGQFSNPERPPFYFEEKRGWMGLLLMENRLENIRLSDFKKERGFFSRKIALRRLGVLPGGGGEPVAPARLGIEPYLLFSLHLTPHRFNHLPHVLVHDPDFSKTRRSLRTALRAGGFRDAPDFHGNEEYLRFVFGQWGRFAAACHGRGLFKSALHVQDKDLAGGESDDDEFAREPGDTPLLQRLHHCIGDLMVHMGFMESILEAGNNEVFPASPRAVREYLESFFGAYFSTLRSRRLLSGWRREPAIRMLFETLAEGFEFGAEDGGALERAFAGLESFTGFCLKQLDFVRADRQTRGEPRVSMNTSA
jgi:hypothetical protein